MSLFTILPSYINLGSNLTTEIHIPVVVIQSCIWHSVLLLVKCSKPTAHAKNNLQSIMLDHQTPWHGPQPQKRSHSKTLIRISQKLFRLSTSPVTASTSPIYKTALSSYALWSLYTHKAVKSQETSNMKLCDCNYVSCGTRFRHTITYCT